jgi:hypothetical protein
MEGEEQVILWKRAWHMPNGDVHSTLPYLFKEELLKAEPEQGSHGNGCCSEPFSASGGFVLMSVVRQIN